MIEFWKRNGEVFAYLDDDGKSIYLWCGKPVAWLSEGSAIFTYCGKHLGWLTTDFVCDRFGNPALFAETSLDIGSKVKFTPWASIPRGVRGARPVRYPTVEIPPKMPKLSGSRSPYNEELFFSQYD